MLESCCVAENPVVSKLLSESSSGGGGGGGFIVSIINVPGIEASSVN
jgi:hypothetical protein